MKLLIEISEEYYKAIIEIPNHQCTADMLLIKYGTLLPEHHGRLIDADVLVDGMEDDYEFCEVVNATPTIIPATGNEFFNFDAPIIKKHTATKEGESE